MKVFQNDAKRRDSVWAVYFSSSTLLLYRCDKSFYDYLAIPHAVKVYKSAKAHNVLESQQYLVFLNVGKYLHAYNFCNTT